MRENIVEALLEIWGHKMRSLLTMLGVIIGIAAIIAIVSTIKGTNDQIMENLVGKGNNNVRITLKQGEYDYIIDEYTPAPSGISVISDYQKKEIRDIEHVVDASFYCARTFVSEITFGGNTLSGASLYGVDSHYLNTTGCEIYEGRKFVKSDEKEHHKVAILDSTAADTLFFGKSAVGSTIEIKGEPFVVVGLFRSKKSFAPEIRTLSDYETFYSNSYGTVLVPQACWPILYGFDEPQNAVVRADDTEKMSAVGKAAQEIMRKSVSEGADKEINYAAEDMMEEAKNQQQLANSTNRLLIWVASIALVVGGIGVMNIMLVSVTERTREIGLKRSLGARKRRILIQFLTESAVLTSLGGVLGVVVGILLAEIISRITNIPVGISIPAIVISVAFSVVIGLVFGLLPSIRAANLSPIDALRRE